MRSVNENGDMYVRTRRRNGSQHGLCDIVMLLCLICFLPKAVPGSKCVYVVTLAAFGHLDCCCCCYLTACSLPLPRSLFFPLLLPSLVTTQHSKSCLIQPNLKSVSVHGLGFHLDGLNGFVVVSVTKPYDSRGM